MAVITTGTSGYGDLSSFVQKAMLERAQAERPLSAKAKKYNLPTKSSRTTKWQRMERIPPSQGPDSGSYSYPATVRGLVEGVVPTSVTPTLTTISAQVQQYGAVMQLADQADSIHETPLFAEMLKLLSENQKDTYERVIWAGILSGTQLGYATDSIGTLGSSGRNTVAGKINSVALDKVIRTLDRADAKPMFGAMKAGGNINTEGLLESYMAVVAPVVSYDLYKMAEFVPANRYSGSALPGEIGAYKKIRFFESTLAEAALSAGAVTGAGTVFQSTNATNNDVYPIVIFGADAFGAVDLASSLETLVVTGADSANPLAQWKTAGYKFMAVSTILNDYWIYRLEVAVSV